MPRFISSDFSSDYTRTTPGHNRNFDLRREFMGRADRAAIATTSIMNGAFMDMLGAPKCPSSRRRSAACSTGAAPRRGALGRAVRHRHETALFKLGTDFTIESRSEDSSFSLHVDVTEWQRDPDNWNFPLTTADGADRPLAETGTTLTVTRLHGEVSEDLALDPFNTGLAAELRAKHRMSIGRGLRITVSGADVEPWPIELLAGDQLVPGRLTTTYAAGRLAPVVVRAVAGVGEFAPSEAGWYVFCNSRLVVGPDQTILTGWGEGRGHLIPRVHTQFARFRGCNEVGLPEVLV